MYFFFFIYLIINTTLTSSKTIYKVDGKRSTSDSKLSCKNIKCPPMENPVCVKVTKIDKQKHEKFILAINKCNMLFMKCHPAGKKHDVTLCGIRKENVLRKIHEDSTYDKLEGTFKNKNKILIGKVNDEDENIYDDVEKQPRDIAKANSNDKVKPELSDANDDLGEEDDKEERPADDNDELGDVNNKEEPLGNKYDYLGEEGDKEEQPADYNDKLSDVNNKEGPLGNKYDDLGEEDDKEDRPADDNDELGDVNNKEEPLSDKYDDPGVEDNKEIRPAVDINRSDNEKNEDNLPGDNDNEDSAGDNNDNVGDINKQEDLPGVKTEEPDDEYKGEDDKDDDTFVILQEQEDEKDTNVVPVDYDQNTNDNVNSDEYKKNCPTDCPAREVMVCAKCQHNIYRSFLSSCHLRAFSCKHPDEKLELVNRKPCIQSAPFLTDLPSPKGRVSEPSDKDAVLQYIRCREKGRLNKDDPRCNFEDKKSR